MPLQEVLILAMTEMLDALEEKGYISQTRRAKKLALTEEGVSQAQEIRERYGL